MDEKLGKEAKDLITGFKGIITGKASYLYGCSQYLMSPKIKKGTGEIQDGQWFDEGRIKIIGKGISPDSVRVKDPGGPSRGPLRY